MQKPNPDIIENNQVGLHLYHECAGYSLLTLKNNYTEMLNNLLQLMFL